MKITPNMVAPVAQLINRALGFVGLILWTTYDGDEDSTGKLINLHLVGISIGRRPVELDKG